MMIAIPTHSSGCKRSLQTMKASTAPKTSVRVGQRADDERVSRAVGARHGQLRDGAREADAQHHPEIVQRSAWKLDVESCHAAHRIEPITVNQKTTRQSGSPSLPSVRTERYAHAENTPENRPISATASLPPWNVGCRRTATPTKPNAMAAMSQLRRTSRQEQPRW